MHIFGSRARSAAVGAALLLPLAGCPSPHEPPIAVISDPAAVAATPDGGTCMELGDAIDGRLGEAPALSSGCSTAPSGGRLVPYWSLLEQPPGSTAAIADPEGRIPTFVPDMLGDYLVELVVSDGVLTSAPDFITVHVIDICGSNDPTVSATVSAPSTNVGVGVQFEAVGADPDNDAPCSLDQVLTYAWNLVEVPAGSSATLTAPTGERPSLTPDVPGTYVAEVVATDSTGRSSRPARASFTASPCGTAPPIAIAEKTAPSGTVLCDGSRITVDLGGATNEVLLDAAMSHDPDNDSCGATQTLFYEWTILTTTLPGDARLRPNSTGQTTVLDVGRAGEYRVRLLVTDSTGRTSTEAICFLDIRNPN